MTLQELLSATLQQLDRPNDAQTLETWRDKLTRYLNDAIVDITDTISPRRTDDVEIKLGSVDLSTLERCCIKVTALEKDKKRVPFYYGAGTNLIHVKGVSDGAAKLTYRYMPRQLAVDTDVPDLPEYCHGALVMYAVARERSAGDSQPSANAAFSLYERQRRKLKKHVGEADAFCIENIY